MRALRFNFGRLQERGTMARGLTDERQERGGRLGALPSHVQDLPSESRESVVAVLVPVLRRSPEVELAAVRLDTQAQVREGDVDDPRQSAELVVDTVLAHERRKIRAPHALLDELLEPRPADIAAQCCLVEEIQEDPSPGLPWPVETQGRLPHSTKARAAATSVVQRALDDIGGHDRAEVGKRASQAGGGYPVQADDVARLERLDPVDHDIWDREPLRAREADLDEVVSGAVQSVERGRAAV
jgi:hypothetical protein